MARKGRADKQVNLEQVQAHPDHAFFGFGNALKGGLREVDNPAAAIRPPVIDAHHHTAGIAQIGDPHNTAKRQAAVGGSHGVDIDLFAVGSATFAMKAAVVIRGQPNTDGQAGTGLCFGRARETAQQTDQRQTELKQPAGLQPR